jgi:hypothetical protein
LGTQITLQTLGEFQRAIDPTLKIYKQPATLRFEVFTCGRSWAEADTTLCYTCPKIGWLLATKAAVQQLLTLASADFAEVQSAVPKPNGFRKMH